MCLYINVMFRLLLTACLISVLFSCRNHESAAASRFHHGPADAIVPPQRDRGARVLTAAGGEPHESMQISAVAAICAHKEISTFFMNPGVSAEQIYKLGGFDDNEINISVSEKSIVAFIQSAIDAEEKAKLRNKWKALPGPKDPFKDWLAAEIDASTQTVMNHIDEAIAEAQKKLLPKLDELSQLAADNINKQFSKEVGVAATYSHDMDDFDPGKPGWSKPILLLPPDLDEIQTDTSVDIDKTIPVQIGGIIIGRFPFTAEIAFRFSAELAGFNGMPDAWKPTLQTPHVTSKFKLTLAFSCSRKTTAKVGHSLDGTGLGLSGNYTFPLDGIQIEMKAERDDCHHPLVRSR